MTGRPRRPFVVSVADLLRRAGQSRDIVVDAPLEELRVIDTRTPEGADIHLAVRAESLPDGVVVRGTVTAPWVGSCRRCLEPVGGVLEAEVIEVFEAEPTEGETSPLDGDRIDLEPLAREAVLLDLPIAPLCRDDCAGLCPTCGAALADGDCGCVPPVSDPRWAGLEGITFDE